MYKENVLFHEVKKPVHFYSIAELSLHGESRCSLIPSPHKWFVLSLLKVIVNK
jgi:hypothetical protein